MFTVVVTKSSLVMMKGHQNKQLDMKEDMDRCMVLMIGTPDADLPIVLYVMY